MSAVIGDGEVCVVPGCPERAKDARAFCHNHWMRLPNQLRRKIGKLYASSRRGHHRNPRQAAWKRLIEDAVIALVGAQPLPTPRAVLPMATEFPVRRREFEPPPPDEIDQAAKEAIRDLNKPKTSRKLRVFVHATPELRSEIAQQLSPLTTAKKQRIAQLAGLSITTVREAARGADGRSALTQVAALAIRSALFSMNGGASQIENNKVIWLSYLESRLKSGKAWPTPEEAFFDALEWKA